MQYQKQLQSMVNPPMTANSTPTCSRADAVALRTNRLMKTRVCQISGLFLGCKSCEFFCAMCVLKN